MPYTAPGDGYESSARDNYIPLVQSEAIQEKLDEYERTVPDVEGIGIDGVLTPVDEFADADGEITTYIGVDGSYNEVPADHDHPTDKVGFLQTAAPRADAKTLHEPTDGRFVDPAVLEAMVEPDRSAGCEQTEQRISVKQILRWDSISQGVYYVCSYKSTWLTSLPRKQPAGEFIAGDFLRSVLRVRLQSQGA